MKPVIGYTLGDQAGIGPEVDVYKRQHLCFDIEDLRNTLAQRKQEFHALQYQYNAYAAKLADFKQSHPVD